MKKFKIYRDGKDLYVTDKKLQDTEYEEYMGEYDTLEEATLRARFTVLKYGKDSYAYVWVDTDIVELVDASDIGEFRVIKGQVIEIEKHGRLSC